jgi:hypothetical protein
MRSMLDTDRALRLCGLAITLVLSASFVRLMRSGRDA